MLVLTRKPGEALILADEVKVTVLEVKGKQVRLGIDAPADVEVHREEIYLRIEREQDVHKKRRLTKQLAGQKTSAPKPEAPKPAAN